MVANRPLLCFPFLPLPVFFASLIYAKEALWGNVRPVGVAGGGGEAFFKKVLKNVSHNTSNMRLKFHP